MVSERHLRVVHTTMGLMIPESRRLSNNNKLLEINDSIQNLVALYFFRKNISNFIEFNLSFTTIFLLELLFSINIILSLYFIEFFKTLKIYKHFFN